MDKGPSACIALSLRPSESPGISSGRRKPDGTTLKMAERYSHAQDGRGGCIITAPPSFPSTLPLLSA